MYDAAGVVEVLQMAVKHTRLDAWFFVSLVLQPIDFISEILNQDHTGTGP